MEKGTLRGTPGQLVEGMVLVQVAKMFGQTRAFTERPRRTFCWAAGSPKRARKLLEPAQPWIEVTFIAAEPFHLSCYLGQQGFRYNSRTTKRYVVGDRDRFQTAMSHIANRRFTYEQLTGEGSGAVHQA